MHWPVYLSFRGFLSRDRDTRPHKTPTLFQFCVYLLGVGCVLTAAHGAAKAANSLNGLDFQPGATTLLIYDQAGRLSSQRNIKLLRAYNYRVELASDCSDQPAPVCLAAQARAIKAARPEGGVLLLTTGRHSEALNALYAAPSLYKSFDGIVLFRTTATSHFKVARRLDQAPPLLLIVREADDLGAIQRSRVFADRVRAAGAWSWFVMIPRQAPKRHHKPPVVYFLDYFIGAKRLPAAFREGFAGNAFWQHPPYDLDPFHKRAGFIRPFKVSAWFEDDMREFFQAGWAMARQWRFKTYQAFDFLAYRDSQPQLKGRRYLVLRNKIGQFLSLDLEKYAAYRPVIVVGIDHEKNLFRINWFFKNKAQYSWRPRLSDPKISVNPLGAFLHFQKPLPKSLEIAFSTRSKLSFDSLRFVDEDPLKPLHRYSSVVKRTITSGNHCINCHSLDGLGGKAHHIQAENGLPQGGFALALRHYPNEVLRAFLYNQEDVAAQIGVAPNPVSQQEAKALWALLAHQ